MERGRFEPSRPFTSHELPHFHAAFPFSGEKLPQAKQGSPSIQFLARRNIGPVMPAGVCKLFVTYPECGEDSAPGFVTRVSSDKDNRRYSYQR